jgi:Flp pilus assembly CpaF family ATPase
LPALRAQLASAIDAVVQTHRRPDGSRGVHEIALVTAARRGYALRTLYREEPPTAFEAGAGTATTEAA